MGKRILVLLFGNIALLVIALMIFDTLGVIDYRSYLYDNLPFVKSYFEKKIEDPSLIEKESLIRYKQDLDYIKKSLDKREEEIKRKEEELKNKELELQQKFFIVEEMQKNLEKEKQIFKDYDAKLTKIANYIISLPPNSAVKILENMDDNLIADILIKMDQIAERQGQQSLSSYLLSMLPPDRAARVSEKIIQK